MRHSCVSVIGTQSAGHMRRAASFISELSANRDASDPHGVAELGGVHRSGCAKPPEVPPGRAPSRHSWGSQAFRKAFRKGWRMMRGGWTTIRSGGGHGRTMSARRAARRGPIARSARLAFVALVVVAVVKMVVMLASWCPGDETLRAASEGPLRLMMSRSGVSFGTTREVHFGGEVKIDAGDGAIRETSKGYVVQGKIARRPRWTADMNVTAEAEVTLAPAAARCFFRVHRLAPRITLYDNGRVVVHTLGGGEDVEDDARATIDELTCSHFRAMSSESHDALMTAAKMGSTHAVAPVAPAVTPEGSAGRTLMMNSATTLDMLSEYHRPLLNHQAYAERHGYGFVLALVKPSALRGRSGKFAKHLAMGMQAAQTFIPGRASAGATWDSVCHMDLDAWHASWQPFSVYADTWARDKDLLFGDTGQIWLNSGLMCIRPTRWAVAFTQRVVNAVFSGTSPDDAAGQAAEVKAGRPVWAPGGGVAAGSAAEDDGGESSGGRVSYGFKRDQPAMWHVLSETWAEEDAVPYKAQACEAWHRACNPDENPIECWHWCHWDALQRIPGGEGSGGGLWRGLDSISRLSHVQLSPRASDAGDGPPPPLHRMCLRSCRSVLARAAMGACSLVTGGASFCWPQDVDKMSLCDGRGCLAQMVDRGGAWMKHTGHQHWRDVLPTCVPTSEEEARWEQKDYAALCARPRS